MAGHADSPLAFADTRCLKKFIPRSPFRSINCRFRPLTQLRSTYFERAAVRATTLMSKMSVNNHEGARPRLGVPVVKRRDRVRVHLHRQRGDRLHQPLMPKAVVERGKQQRRGFAGDAGDGQHEPGDERSAGRSR